MAGSIKFKFKFVDGQGNEKGFLNKKGAFDGDTLVLGRQSVSVLAMGKVLRRYQRLILEVMANGETQAVAVAVRGGVVKKLHEALNRIGSRRRVEARQEALREAGEVDRFRAVACPLCKATLDLTGFLESPQLYCEYCDSVITVDRTGPADERRFALCDETGLFSQPREFTIFYFYFLLVLYGWRYRKVHMSNAAMKPHAWKMLFFNLPFVLGVPAALIQLVRVYRGGEATSREFAGLGKANALAVRGKTDRAVACYREITERLGVAAGVRLNEGLALVQAGRTDEAAAAVELALVDCSNYKRAAEVLAACLAQLGREEELSLLTAQWNNDREAIEAALDRLSDAA